MKGNQTHYAASFVRQVHVKCRDKMTGVSEWDSSNFKQLYTHSFFLFFHSKVELLRAIIVISVCLNSGSTPKLKSAPKHCVHMKYSVSALISPVYAKYYKQIYSISVHNIYKGGDF